MEISKYFSKKNYLFGDIITMVVNDLFKKYNYDNVLFVRTYTTGHWLDNLLTEKNNVDRILYYTDKVNKPRPSHILTSIIHSDDFENHIISLNKKYDLICFDTYHEYDVSSRDFKILYSVLNENGILISHDCFPWNKTVANPYFIKGKWCGETYISFVNFAYENPNLYYAIINTDTGIGIISKKYLPFLSNKLNKEKQEQLLYLYKNSENYYEYFIKNSEELINSITMNNNE